MASGGGWRVTVGCRVSARRWCQDMTEQELTEIQEHLDETESVGSDASAASAAFAGECRASARPRGLTGAERALTKVGRSV